MDSIAAMPRAAVAAHSASLPGLFEEPASVVALRGPGDSLIGLANEIVRAPARAMRTSLLDLIAPGYRDLVGKLATDMLGTDIALIRGSDARRAAIEQVPVEIVDAVCARVVMLMQAAKELRAMEASRAPGAVLL